jgi:hypothetical protein
VGYLGAGVLTLGVLFFLARLYASIEPGALARTVRYTVGFGLVGTGIVLSVAGRVAFGLILIGAGASAIARGRIGPFDLGGSRRSPGSTSAVGSAYLKMRLDHDTGAMTGQVVRGRETGKSLDELDEAALVGLRREIAADGESVALLEAYLDRRIPGWRENVEADRTAGPGGAADARPMTDEQAYEILGLLPGADEAEIRAAHRRLMKGVHPDSGGSTFLAAKINQAKDWLLGKHR